MGSYPMVIVCFGLGHAKFKFTSNRYAFLVDKKGQPVFSRDWELLRQSSPRVHVVVRIGKNSWLFVEDVEEN